MSRFAVVAHLKERCSNYRAVLLETGVCTAEELQAIWPGGADNPARDVTAWLYTYWNIARFMARDEARNEYAAGASSGRSDHLLHLQQGTPRVVALSRPITIDETEVAELTLHHKSFTALRRLATYARLASQLLVYIDALEQRPEHADLIVEAQEWRARILLMLVWGAVSTDEEGRTTGLPWNPWDDAWPVLPAWLESLSLNDLLQVQFAYAETYGRALLAVAPFIAPNDEQQDPLAGWETFFAAYGTEKGLEAQHLMQDRAFLPFLTQVSLAAHSNRHARESAKSESAAAGVT